MKRNKYLVSSMICLFWLGTCSDSFAQKKEALKAIDPSEAEYDSTPAAPPPPSPPPATSAVNNPFGSGIQGQPLGAPQRTLQNPNPPSGYYLPDTTQAPPGWANNGQPGADTANYERRVQRLEQITFGSPYPEHDVEDRIDHLENEVFSNKNVGMPIDQRLAKLETKLLGQSAFGQSTPAPISHAVQTPSAYPVQQAPPPWAGQPYAKPQEGSNTSLTQPQISHAPVYQQGYPAPQGYPSQPSYPAAQQYAGSPASPNMQQPARPYNSSQPPYPGASPAVPGYGLQTYGQNVAQSFGATPGNQAALPPPLVPYGIPSQGRPGQQPYGQGIPAPYAGSPAPYGGSPAPYGGSSAPYGGNPAPYGGNSAPYGGNPAPYGGNPAPYGGNSAPYGGNPAPYGGNSAPYASSPAPHGDIPASLGSNATSYGSPAPHGSSQIPPISPAASPNTKAAAATQSKTVGLGLSRSDRANADKDNIVKSIPQKPGAGEYFAAINKFAGGSVARWTSFPVLIHLPQGSPSPWQKTLEDSVASWGKYIPVRVATASESADVEIAWINHLQPRSLGQTNLEVFNGRMRVTVYLLRPSYYVPGTPEKILSKVAEHEIGHAIGIFGHSSAPGDLMYPIENTSPKYNTKYSGITARDLNTLREIYESPALPPGFQSPHPMGWSLIEK